MITAIVRYRLPVSIDHDACLEHGIADGGYLEGTVEVLGKPRRQALETSLQK